MLHANATTSSIIQDGRKIITSTFADGSECVEEVDMKTELVLGTSLSYCDGSA
jgi:hypothetical protein